MSRALVSVDGTATLVGGGGATTEDIVWACGQSVALVAADGGAAAVLAANRMPEAVIGDLDSLDPGSRAQVPDARIHRVSEQDSTDFAKCLSRIEARMIIGLGFLGARLDHTLAALNVLVRHEGKCLLVGPEDAAFHVPRSVRLDLPRGVRLSIFPMRELGGRSTGLEWPIDGIALAPSAMTATSNRVTGPVSLDFDGPGAVVIVPRAWRNAVLAAISNSGR